MGQKTTTAVAKKNATPPKKAPAKVAAKATKAPATKPAKVAAKPAKTPAKPAKTPEVQPTLLNPKVEKAAKAALKKEKTAAATVEASPVTETAPVEKPAAKTRTRKISVEVAAGEAAGLVQKWNSLFKKADQIESKPYNMRGIFEEKTAITHKVLGWGYILANRNDRLEVLFKDGIKFLISNYKA